MRWLNQLRVLANRIVNFVRHHRLKTQYRRPFWGATSIVLIAIIFLLVHGESGSSTSQHPTAEKQPQNIATQVTDLATVKIQTRLRAYLKRVATTQDVSVTFYNLAPVAGSSAAKDTTDGLNTPGTVTASIHGNKKRTASDLDKLYIAAYLSHQKKLTWSANDLSGFETMMIHNSDRYGDSILNRYGKVTLNRYLKTLKLKAVFSYVQPSQTTSNNVASMLRRLADQKAPFTNAKRRRMILSDMGQQVFRTGIPAGINSILPEAKIQDVIGYSGTVNNDAAIVTTKDGQRFVLVIMTKGAMQQDFEVIGDIANRVTEIVYFKG